MADEPINIYSRKIDPAGVLDVLRRLDPGVVADGEGSGWTRATVTVKRGLLRKPLKLTFMHDVDYYDGDDFPRQMNGKQGYFSRFPLHDRQADVMRTIAAFRFSLATNFEPDRAEAGYDDDPRMAFVYAVAKHLDAAIFTPSALRDAAGRTLAAADGEQDPAAEFPQLPPVPEAEDDAADDEDPPPEPPTADRVARRTLALAAVGARGLLEQEDPADPGVEETRQRLLQWIADIDIGDELEPDEWKVLQRPHGKLSRQEAVNATWRLEGLGVLAWALNRFEVPPIDVLVDPGKLLPAVGILNAERAAALLAEPPLRPAAELEGFASVILALNWRMVDYRVNPRAMNFSEFVRTAQWGPLSIDGVRLIDDDLAIGDAAIASADADRVGAAQSAAVERHQAANWLLGDAAVYSEVATNT